MTQMPPPPVQGAVPPYPPAQPPRTNGWAIASLICGLLGCLEITGLLAIVFGILGINKSKEPGVGGRGLSIAGIIIALIMMIVGGGIGYGSYWTYGFAKRMLLQPTEQAGNAFLGNLAKGDIATAKAHTTGEMSDQQLQSLSDQVKGLGNFKDFSLSSFQANQAGGNEMSVNIGGVAHFANGDKNFTATLVGTKTGNSYSFKIEDFKLR